ncbi:cyclin-like protein [Melampsora americana]|nr:cyclin-like protein [Melampsora americana]
MNSNPILTSTSIPLFELSTQFRHWRFSESGLEKARKDLNEGAVGRVRSKLEEERRVDTQDGMKIEEDTQLSTSAIEYLTVADELSLVTFYLTKISQLCRASFFRLPETVEATAMTYLKRFYLRNTCMDYHPKNIMLTCLFLATKTENTSISIDSFASRIPKTTNDDVLSMEFLVAQSLRFEFKVHHAHLAARGIYLDLQQTSMNSGIGQGYDIELLNERWLEVKDLLRSSRLTDAEFLWTPSQIATAAWWICDPEGITEWIKSKAQRIPQVNQTESSSSSSSVEKHVKLLMSYLPGLVDLIKRSKTTLVDKERVTAIDRRLKYCRNPEKDPNSNLYKIKLKQSQQEELAKQQEKNLREKVDDPFT